MAKTTYFAGGFRPLGMIGLRGQILVRLIGERHSTGNEALFVVKDDGLQRKWEDLDDFIGRGIFLGIVIMLQTFQHANMKLNMELES